MTDAQVGRVATKALLLGHPDAQVGRIATKALLRAKADAWVGRVATKALISTVPDITPGWWDGTTIQPLETLGSIASDLIWDAKGDLVVGSGPDAAGVLPVGADGKVLTTDATQPLGVKWATPSGGGSAYQPGSADAPPASPNAKNAEYDGTGSVVWTATPTAPTAIDRNATRASHLYIKAAGTGGAYVGEYQAVPASYPYTITAKLAGSTGRGNYHRGGGIILAPAAPTNTSNIYYGGMVFNSSRAAQRVIAQFGGSFVSQSGTAFGGHWGPFYFKVVVASATSVSLYASTDGYAWVLIESAFNPGFTPAFMGTAINEEGAGGGVEAFFDFFRVS